MRQLVFTVAWIVLLRINSQILNINIVVPNNKGVLFNSNENKY